MRKKAEFYRTNRCKFNASQTSAVFLTCRVEFVAAVKIHVQLQANIHGAVNKTRIGLLGSDRIVDRIGSDRTDNSP